MTTEPLNPSINLPAYNKRYAENDWGILAAICQCIQIAGGPVVSYPPNTAGIIRALSDLATVIATITGGSTLISFTMTAGEDLDHGDVVYIDANGTARKATAAGSREEATVIGLSSAAVPASSAINVVLLGGLVGYTTLVPGSEYYLSAAAPGAMSTTPPAGSGEFVVKVGEALSANTFMVRPTESILLS